MRITPPAAQPLTLGPRPITRAKAALLVSILGVLCGCAKSAQPSGASWDSVAVPVVPKTTPCATGATRACGIELGTYAGLVSCVAGSQTCDNNVWSACKADAA